MKVSFSGIFQGYDTIGIPYAMHTYEMTVTDYRQTNLGEFEQASQKLLLDISLEASNNELRKIVASRHKPVGLPGYYRSLQTWRSPVLHQVDA